VNNFLETYQEQARPTATIDVIDTIFGESRLRTDNHVNLVTSRHLLGKNQYMEIKADVTKQLMHDLKHQEKLLLHNGSSDADDIPQPPKDDIIDLIIRESINLQITDKLKDSDFLIPKCGEEGSPFLQYKRKNFMNEKAKTQREVVDKLRIKMKFRREEL
jgi:hypothetical protein